MPRLLFRLAGAGPVGHARGTRRAGHRRRDAMSPLPGSLPRQSSPQQSSRRGRWLSGRVALAGAALLVAPLSLTACSDSGGSSGSSGGSAPEASGAGACTAQKGDQLVVLTDDKKSQNSDNVV